MELETQNTKQKLDWQPRVTFNEIVRIMMDHDMAKAGLEPPGKGIEAVRDKGFGWTQHTVAVHEMVKE